MEEVASQLRSWTGGIGPEIAFWRTWLATRGDRWPEGFARRTNPATPLEATLAKWAPTDDNGLLRILDVGSGPITSIGYTLPNRAVEVVPVDPLADVYSTLCSEAGVSPPVPTQFALTEDLDAFFAPEQFDLVHCRNALDHSFDPLRGINQMLTMAKPGGRIVLSHHPNEAERESYAGFHQFNFEIRAGRFVIWNRQVEIDVATSLSCPCTVRPLPGHMVDVVIEKTGPAPAVGGAAHASRLRAYLAAFVAVAASPAKPATVGAR